MKTFDVEVSWTVLSSATIEAESEEDAREIAMNAPLNQFCVGSYLSGSFEVDNINEI